MSFLRKLIRGGDGDRRRAGPSDEAPERPDDATPSPRRRYLEYVGGSSAKFYAAVLHTGANEGWSVAFNFGRIGYPRAWALKVAGAPFVEARSVYDGLLAEKAEKGYETRPWPGSLAMPDGADDVAELDVGEAPASTPLALYVSPAKGALPPESGAVIAGVFLPPGLHLEAEEQGGPRGSRPLLWVSEEPVGDVTGAWSTLASAFPATGLWPLVVDMSEESASLSDTLMDTARARATGAPVILRRWWRGSLGSEEDFPHDDFAPFGPEFPGLADTAPGQRPESIEHLVQAMRGHLGLAAVHRPGDVLDAIGWSGALNYDFNPSDLSTVLRSWEDRFDAYLVGLGFDTITLVVGRPPRDRAAATAIAAEHAAFCPDNIWQGVGTVRRYAELLVDARRWDFWWD